MEVLKTEENTPAAPALNDLKAAVYDKLALQEQHQRYIQQIQKEIQDLNMQIVDLLKNEKAPA